MPTPPPIPPYDTDIEGGPNGDNYNGTPGRNRYAGNGGDDFLRGGDGDDVLLGGADNDFIQGQNGNDYIEGGDGNDIVRGDAGDDTVFGGAGDDQLRGGAGIDILDGGEGNDRISFFELNQTQGVVADLALQTMSNDGYGNSETLVSIEGLGADTRFVDTFLGSDVANILLASSNDIIEGRGGDDMLQVGAALTGGGTIDGGSGIDMLQLMTGYLTDANGDGIAEVLDTGVGMSVNLSLASNQLVNDGLGHSATIVNVENLGGTAFDDILVGNGDANVLNGGLGNDTLSGGDGTDVAVYAKASSSYAVVSDGAGGFLVIDRETLEQDSVTNVETLRFSDGDFAPAAIALSRLVVNPAGSPNITGGANGDYILGDERANFLQGRGGDDFIDGRGNPSLTNELLRGDDGNDTIVGGEGDDQLRGGAGVDRFFGGNGFDRVSLFEAAATQAVNANLLTQTINNDGFGNVEQMSSIEGLGAGTRFSDTFIGDDVRNLILGDSSDTITANGGDDDIQLGGSTAGGGGIDGGTGIDFITFFTSDKQEDTNGDGIADSVAATIGVTIDLSQSRIVNDGFGNSAQLLNFEGVTGGNLADTLIGNDAANRFGMTTGADVIDGRGGIDVLDTGTALRADHSVARTANGYAVTQTYTGFVFNPVTNMSDPVTMTTTTNVTNVERIRFSDGEFDLDALVPNTPTEGDDNLVGTAGDDTINALGGNDIVNGRAGNDSIDGGAGTDVAVYAKASSSYAVVSDGAGGFLVIDRETLEQDVVTNVETLRFSNGDFTPASIALNRIILAPGTDNLGAGGSPNGDYIVGNDGYNLINGNGGDDFIVAGGNGGAEPSVDNIRGNAGNDTLVGGAGADLLRGGAGIDRYFGMGGNDRISFFDVTATQGASADLETGTITNDGFGNVEVFSGIEGLGGATRFVDTFRGDGGNNLILGDSADTLQGRGGDDRFQLSGSVTGGGTVDGGDGFDVIAAITADRQEDTNGDGIADSVAATQGVSIDLSQNRVLNDGFGNQITLVSIEGLGGGGLNDTLIGNDGDNRIFLSNGTDAIDGRGGTDTIDSSSVTSSAVTVTRTSATSYLLTDATGLNSTVTNVESIQFSNGTFTLASLVTVGAGNDYIEGTAGADTLDGQAGNDTIVGLDGDDSLTGGDGDDSVTGGNGNDTIVGGAGSDSLNGGNNNDTITAGDGSDTVIGGSGNDTIITGDSDGAADTYIAGTSSAGGASNLDVLSYRTNTAGVIVSLALQGAAQNTGSEGMDTIHGFTRLEGGQGNDMLTGNNQLNLLSGLGGDDLLDAGSQIGAGGAPVPKLLDGGDGFDTAVFSGNRADYEFTFNPTTGRIDVLPLAIDATVGLVSIERVRFADGDFLPSQLNIFRTNGDDVIVGSRQTDTINGLDGNDVITSRGGGDILNGGEGNDILDAGTPPGGPSFGPDNDTLNGGNGDDTLTGGVGDDSLTGGDGDDIAIVNVSTDGSDSVNLGAGSDTVLVSGGGQVRLTFTSGEVGNANTNDAGTLANQDGGLALRMQAEDGSDVLTGPLSRYDDEGIIFVAAAGATFDVRDLVSGVARGNAFRVATLGTAAGDTLTAVNASLSYYINAGAGDDTISGGGATDFLVGGEGNDIVSGGGDNDGLLGGNGNDSLDGGDGNDSIDGGAGADTLTGGSGSDTYTADENDIIVELVGGGFDTVLSARSHTLAANVENLTLSGTAVNGIGNDIDNVIGGTAVFNLLRGGDGNDRLFGFGSGDQLFGDGGSDILDGGDGNDELDGGAGNDDMVGGLGDDAYVVDNVSDLVVEYAGEGSFDRVTSTVSYSLAANSEVEVLSLVGAAALVGIGSSTNNSIVGNEFDNTLAGRGGDDVIKAGAGNDILYGDEGDDDLRGGSGNDILEGGTGGDIMSGGTGDDYYYVDDGADILVESAGGGIDEAAVSVSYTLGVEVENAFLTGSGNLDLTGNASANTLNGNGGNNRLDGGDGEDVLGGGLGNDILVGGNGNDILKGGDGNDIVIGGNGIDSLGGRTGSDTFRFLAVGDSGTTLATADRITDFSAAQGDKIDLAGIDAISGGGDDSFTFIGSGAFTGVAGQLRAEVSGSTQLLSGDVDGDGVADFLIVVTAAGGVPLVTADFLL